MTIKTFKIACKLLRIALVLRFLVLCPRKMPPSKRPKTVSRAFFSPPRIITASWIPNGGKNSPIFPPWIPATTDKREGKLRKNFPPQKPIIGKNFSPHGYTKALTPYPIVYLGWENFSRVFPHGYPKWEKNGPPPARFSPITDTHGGKPVKNLPTRDKQKGMY